MYRVYFDNFHLDIYESDNIKEEIIKNLKTHHLSSVLSKYERVNNWEEKEEEVWERDRPMYFPISIEKLPECDGCRYDCPAQKDHMGPGGCLN